jgi:hypothetical protein
MDPQHMGSNFDDFLREVGLLEEVEAVAAKRVLDFETWLDSVLRRLPPAPTVPLEELRRENLYDEES